MIENHIVSVVQKGSGSKQCKSKGQQVCTRRNAVWKVFCRHYLFTGKEKISHNIFCIIITLGSYSAHTRNGVCECDDFFFLSRVTCSFKCDRKNCNQLSTPTIASLEVIYIMLCLWMHKGNWLAVMWPCKTMPQLLILTQLLLAESCLSLRPCFKARLLYSHATVSKNCVLLCHKLNHSVTCSVRCTLITSLKAITKVTPVNRDLRRGTWCCAILVIAWNFKSLWSIIKLRL